MTTKITNMRELKVAQYELEKMMRLPKDKREGFEALVAAIEAYESKHFPYGTPEFEQWAEHIDKHPEEDKQVLEEIREAEAYLEEIKEFERKRIAAIRKSIRTMKIKQQYMAKALDMNKTYLSNILNGRKPLSIKVIAYAHDFLKIDYQVLIPSFDMLKHVEEDVKVASSVKNRQRRPDAGCLA